MAQKTKFGIVAGLAGAALMISAAPTWAATIVLNDPGYITNPSFETGGLSPWVASSNGAGVYVPGASNYTAGSDGLASGVAPDGTHVAFTPVSGGVGHGNLSQELSTQFVAGNDYKLSVWVAMPFNVQPANCTGAGGSCANNTSTGNPTFSIDLLYATGTGGVGGGVAAGGLTATIAQDGVSISSLGHWALYTIDVASAGNYGDIVINLRSDSISISQPHQVDFDIGTPTTYQGPGETPIPAALPLFAGGLGVLGLLGRRRKNKKAAALAAA